MFQSTPAYGGRHATVTINGQPYDVSIHARVRRATRHQQHIGRAVVVSIHARVRRATARMMAASRYFMFQSTPAYGGRREYLSACHGVQRCFNPRPRTAGDENTYRHVMASKGVSIHARVRRATISRPGTTAGMMFQSTPAYGGRPDMPARRPAWKCFNPRPRTAGDRSISMRSCTPPCFNPRPRTAGDTIADRRGY